MDIHNLPQVKSTLLMGGNQKKDRETRDQLEFIQNWERRSSVCVSLNQEESLIWLSTVSAGEGEDEQSAYCAERKREG